MTTTTDPIRKALAELLAFHDVRHPDHDALHVNYYEACVANEFAPSSDGLHDQLIRQARVALGMPEYPEPIAA